MTREMQEASRLFEAGRVDEAARVIERLRLQSDPPQQALFLSGALYLQQGAYSKAAQEFSRMLARDPGLVRPRLELARALFMAGHYDAARHHFEQCLAGELPDMVRNRVMGYIDAVREHRPSYGFSVEMVSDSNANQATGSRTVQIGNLTYQLSADARARQARGLLWSAQGRYPFPGYEDWYARGSIEYFDYPSRDLDFLYGQATLGKVITLGRHYLNAEVGWHLGNFTGERLYDGPLFRVSDTLRVRPSTSVTVGAESKYLDYEDLPFLEGRHSTLFLESRHAPRAQSALSGTLSFTRADTSEQPYSFYQPGVALRYSQEWPRGWISVLSARRSYSRFRDEDPFFLQRRRDTESGIELGLLNRQLAYRRLAPKITLGYAERRSNIDLYAYHRAFVRVGLVTEY